MTHLCICEIVSPNPCSCLCKSKSSNYLVFTLKLINGVGLPYKSSNGENRIPSQGKLLALGRPPAADLPRARQSPDITLQESA